MKEGYYRATRQVVRLLEEKIENEKSWEGQKGYALSSARLINVLGKLIGEIYTLDDVMEEDKFYRLKVREE